MSKKPRWSFGSRKPHKSSHKGKKIRFKKSDVVKIKRKKKKDPFFFRPLGMMIMLPAIVIGGPVIGCLFILIAAFGQVWRLSHYEKEYTTSKNQTEKDS